MQISKIDINANGAVHEKIQRFGRFLSGMVMPNIGVLLTWGIVTAFFIPTGWMPNETLNALVKPTAHYLIPLLIGFTGGNMVAGVRGGALGAIGTMGIIEGAPEIHQFMGSMIMGPFGGYIIKKFDKSVEGKIPAGFEMLVNNFSLGIIGTIILIFGFLGIGPVVAGIVTILKEGVQTVVEAGLLPLVSIFIEPAKILFLNNAINHGILDTIGIAQVAESGKSVILLLETNPGPGLGVLIAFWVFGKGVVKESAPGAIIIQFIGGIHEIYFPYVLMKPVLLFAVIAGGVSGVFVFTLLNAGLLAPASPGSIFSILAMTPKGLALQVLAGVIVSTIVSFLVASIFLKDSQEVNYYIDLNEAKSKIKKLKNNELDLQKHKQIIGRNIKKIIFACDAGVGSSAMGATTLRKKIIKAGIDIEVLNLPVDEIPRDAELVITHRNLTRRAKISTPNAILLSVRDFINNDAFEQVVEILQEASNEFIFNKWENENIDENLDNNIILSKKNIKLNLKAKDKFEAIITAGELLVELGYVEEDYILAMIERENDLSTYIGQGVAIPHGVGVAKDKIKNSGMVVLQYPEGVQFGEELAYILVGIAGVGDKHLSILGNIATVIEEADGEVLEKLRCTDDINYIYGLFTQK